MRQRHLRIVLNDTYINAVVKQLSEAKAGHVLSRVHTSDGTIVSYPAVLLVKPELKCEIIESCVLPTRISRS